MQPTPPAASPDSSSNSSSNTSKGLASIAHPVRDIVLPLITILAFGASAIGWGVTWGKVSTRVDITEKLYLEVRDENDAQNRDIQSLKDRTHDLERDAKEDRQRFMLLDDYTRGRIQDMPYKPPPPAFWQSDKGDNNRQNGKPPEPLPSHRDRVVSDVRINP